MPRTFDGTDDTISLGTGAASGMTYGTVAMVVRRSGTGAYHSLFAPHSSGGTAGGGLYFADGNEVMWVNAAFSENRGPGISDTTNWYLIVVRKESGGAANPRYSVYNYTSAAWSHANGTGFTGDWTSPGASGTFRLSSWEGIDEFPGHMAAVALWANTVKWSADSTGDALIEASGLAFNLTAWYRSAPSALWVLDQADTAQSLADRTGGGANQSSLTGTAVSTVSMPLFTYGASVGVIRVVSGGVTITLGQPSTTDEALAVTKAVVRTLGQPETTDTALPITRVVTRVLGQPSTTDTALALTRTLARTLGQPETTDTALALGKAVVRILGQPSTTDEALPITKQSGNTIVLGLPETTDTALALSKAVVRTLGLPSVTESALPITKIVTRVLGLPTTTDSTFALTRTLLRTLGQPETTDVALPITKIAPATIVLGLPSTLDEALPITKIHIGLAWTFSPPHRGKYTPDWIRGVSPEKAKTPYGRFDPTIKRFPNVFLLTNGTLTEEQPPSWSQVAKVYYGGHVALIEDPAEYDALVAAGYSPEVHVP